MRNLIGILLLSATFVAASALARSPKSYTPKSVETDRTIHAQTVTNGQAVEIVEGVNLLTASGQTSGYTNTITLAVATTAADVSGTAIVRSTCWIVNSSDSTNCIAVAKSGSWKTDAIVLAAGEAVSVAVTATNSIHGSK
jgi:hypothetical protein